MEFVSSEQASSALELDRTPIPTGPSSTTAAAKGSVIGRPMFVSVCDTNRSKSSGFHYSTGVPEPKKLFVKNLDKVVGEEALRTFFGQVIFPSSLFDRSLNCGNFNVVPVVYWYNARMPPGWSGSILGLPRGQGFLPITAIKKRGVANFLSEISI